MLGWFKKKNAQPVVQPGCNYVVAKAPGTVSAVQAGMVTVDGKIYGKLRSTFVRPGQAVKAGQVIGKR